MDQIVEVVVTVWMFKTAYEVVLTPVTYAVIGWFKRTEGIEAYDRGVSYNPLAIR